MRCSIFTLAPVFLFFLFLTACTQMEFNPGPVVDSAVTSRSTEAECNALEATWPSHNTPYEECLFIAELLQCRLNQGVDEADVAANCTKIDGYTFSRCIKISELLFNYSTVVDSLKREVYWNTNGCSPSFCPGPTTLEACRTLIFNVSIYPGSCQSGYCSLKMDTAVYCCI